MAKQVPFFTGKLSPTAKSVAVIMAGGSGTRFWPVSRSSYPKQFLPFGEGETSLLQATAERVASVVGEGATLVVTANHQSHLVHEQLPEVAIVAEPAARNTAACIGIAALSILKLVGDVPMICLPADHMVWRPEILQAKYFTACAIAREEEVLLTIGIPPTSPETGYGYIESGEEKGVGVFKVKKFYEKPDLLRARQFLSSGRFLWNSGMFVWRPSVILKSLKTYQPELLKQLEELSSRADAGAKAEELNDRYIALPSVSIDVGVMERAENVLMLSGEGLRWSDVGSWHSWAEDAERVSGTGEPVCLGEGIFVDTERCAVFSQSHFSRSASKGHEPRNKERLIALVGVHDLVVVDTDEAILVCHRNRAQDVKRVVDILKEKGRKDLL